MTHKKPVVKAGLPVGKPTQGLSIKNETAPIGDADHEARERKYRAKSALEDIERAEMHKRDKPLMKDVKKHARDKIKALKGIC
jgi:hypothetical protein